MSVFGFGDLVILVANHCLTGYRMDNRYIPTFLHTAICLHLDWVILVANHCLLLVTLKSSLYSGKHCGCILLGAFNAVVLNLFRPWPLIDFLSLLRTKQVWHHSLCEMNACRNYL